MNRILKYTLLGLCGALIAACIICAFLAGRKDREQILCRKVVITIKDSTDNRLVSSRQIRTDLLREYGNVIGTPVDDIDLGRIEEIIDNRNAVLKSQAYTTKDSTLNIEISQRRPVVRFQKGNIGFYADENGYIFPLQPAFASHVQIVDGNIPINFQKGQKGKLTDPDEIEWLNKTIRLVNFIEADKEWKRIIVQIHVNEDEDIILIPREGQEKFLIGKPDEIEGKFERIERYYKAIVPHAGRQTYTSVDLRYRNQIICK